MIMNPYPRKASFMLMTISTKWYFKVCAIILFLALFFATRFPQLGYDEINPDAVNWHYRTEQFLVGLKSGQFEKTYQHYHPAVTLTWVASVPIELIKQLKPEFAVYSHENFLIYHTAVKVTLVVVQAVLSVFIIFLLAQVYKLVKNPHYFWLSLFTVSLFSFEPFFVGNSRLFHMDVLVTLLLFAGLLLSFLAVLKYKWIYAVGAGVFLVAAFLTKSVAIGGVLYAVFLGGFLVYLKYGVKTGIKYCILLLSAFIVVLFAIFPALWVEPVFVLINIFDEAERVGGRKGHEQIFFGRFSENPGPFFYPVVLILKVSLVTLIGTVLYTVTRFAVTVNTCKKLSFFAKAQNKARPKLFFTRVTSILTRSPVLFLALFYIGYFVTMTLPSKKLDRYMLVVYPFLALIAVLGYYEVFFRLKGHLRTIYVGALFVLLSCFILYPLIKTHPYQFTYTSPIFGNAVSANNIIAQKSFGIGIPALRAHIFATYPELFDAEGNFPRLGFIDKKPMGAIYMNSRIYDIRVNGLSDYDLLVLGINEDLPENVVKDLVGSPFTFEHHSSMYINGLEYWRIYVKQAKN